jgi:hypothetical protein
VTNEARWSLIYEGIVTDERAPNSTLFAYLLGELPAAEEAAMDESVFLDDAADERRALAADDLIDAYLGGGLSPARRQRFETHFLAAAVHRDRLRLLRDLRTVVARGQKVPRVSSRPALWAVAAALAVALAAAVLLWLRATPPDPRVAAVPTPGPASTTTATPDLPPTAAARPETETVALPERPRAVELSLGDARDVRFAVPVPETGPPSYSAVVRREGQTIWRRDDVVPSGGGAPLLLTVPTAVLDDGDTFEIQPDAAASPSPAPSPSARAWKLKIVPNAN